MTEPNPPRRHHFIPEFYQRQWIGEDGKIERYEHLHNRIARRRVPPKSAGFREDLYRFPNEDLDEWQAQSLETIILQSHDNAAAKALQSLTEDRSALRDYKVRRDWAVFLRGLLLRTPFQMSATLASMEKLWSDVDVSDKYAELRLPSMPATADEFLKSLNPNIAKETAFKIFMNLMGSDALTHHIVSMPWRIIDCSASDHKVLLSDHPVILVPLRTDFGQIAMPLSPTQILVASSKEHVRQRIDGLRPKQAVRAINRLIVARARHLVIASDRAQEPFIEKHFGKDLIPPFLAPDRLP